MIVDSNSEMEVINTKHELNTLTKNSMYILQIAGFSKVESF